MRLALGLVVAALVGCGDDSAGRDGGTFDAGRDAQGRDAGAEDAAHDAGADAGSPDAGITATVHLIGRWEGNAADARAAWPGSAVWTRFDGTTLSADLEDGGGNWFEVYVDGESVEVLQTAGGRQTVELVSGLPAGPHDLVLARRTESFVGAVRFRGFSGSPLVATPVPERFIEVIGDSISCGYGVLGVGPGCDFSRDTEAETHAWGAFAAADLGAAHATIAYSGIGVYRNCCGDTSDRMPRRYERTFADDATSMWGFTAYTPDVVVVNLGTNDFSGGDDPGTPFVDAYVDFVGQLRGHWPDAFIILCGSPMLGGGDHDRHLGYLEAVSARVSDARLVVLDIAVQDPADGYGCDYHPSEATQRRMADTLVARIRELTGW